MRPARPRTLSLAAIARVTAPRHRFRRSAAVGDFASPPIRLDVGGKAPPASRERMACARAHLGFTMAPCCDAACGCLRSQAPACAEQFVEFDAAAQAQPSAGRAPRIRGYLARPKGAGPFPAVVLLHSCLGLPANRRSIVQALAASGYVALYVDDFGTRGLKETCERRLRRCPARRLWRARVPVAPPLRRPRADRRGRLFARGRHRAQDRIRPIRAGLRRLASRRRRPSIRRAPTRRTTKLRIPTLILVGVVGRGDARGRLRAAGEGARGGFHRQAHRLSRRGASLRRSRVRRRQADHGHGASIR